MRTPSCSLGPCFRQHSLTLFTLTTSFSGSCKALPSTCQTSPFSDIWVHKYFIIWRSQHLGIWRLRGLVQVRTTDIVGSWLLVMTIDWYSLSACDLIWSQMSITDKVLCYAATLQYCTFWLGLKGCREWSWWIAGNGHFHKTKRCSKLLLVRWRWEMMGWRFYTIVRGLCCEQVVRLSDTFRFWASYLFLFSRNDVMGDG